MKPCRVCSRPSTEALDTAGLQAVCARHGALYRAACAEARSLPTSERALGFGVAIVPPDVPGGETNIRCDRSFTADPGHLWTGHAGELCAWCGDLYLAALRDEYASITSSRFDYEPEDIRYREEAERRTDRLIRAVRIGLVSEDEARQAVRRWEHRLGSEAVS